MESGGEARDLVLLVAAAFAGGAARAVPLLSEGPCRVATLALVTAAEGWLRRQVASPEPRLASRGAELETAPAPTRTEAARALPRCPPPSPPWRRADIAALRSALAAASRVPVPDDRDLTSSEEEDDEEGPRAAEVSETRREQPPRISLREICARARALP